MSRRTNSQTYLRPRASDGRYMSPLTEVLIQQALHREKELQRERDLIAELASLSQEKLAWYDDDTNVPPYGSTASRIIVLERLITEAKAMLPRLAAVPPSNSL